MQVPFGRLADLLRRDRADDAGITVQEVEAEPEAPRSDRIGSEVAVAFEPEDEAAGQVVGDALQFVGRRRLAADAPDLGEEAVDRALSVFGRRADVGRERAAPFAAR